MEELKNKIKRAAKAGVDFCCNCYYCGGSPIDLVNRGDAIPIIYTQGYRDYCFRCSDEAYYGIRSEFIKDSIKQKECLKDFRRRTK